MNVEPMRKRRRRNGSELAKHHKRRAEQYTSPTVGDCPSGKHCYVSREAAQMAVSRWARKGVALAAYRHGKHDGGCGLFHLTSR